MYGGLPYVLPNIGAQATAPLANTLSNAASATNAVGTASAASKVGSSLLSKINWASLLSNTQKTLNVVNQAIPLYYQVKPVFKNIKALGRIGKEFSKIGNESNLNVSNNQNTNNKLPKSEKVVENSSVSNIPEPTFFL